MKILKKRTVLASTPPLVFFSAAFFLFFDEVFFSSVPVAADASSRKMKNRGLEKKGLIVLSWTSIFEVVDSFSFWYVGFSSTISTS